MDETSKRILRELCMDSRASAVALAGKVHVSRETVRAKIRKLEKNLDLRYTVELDFGKLGLPFTYLIAVKFRQIPAEDTLQALLAGSSVPQFAATCRGEFDLMIFAAAQSHLDYMRWEFKIRSELGDNLEFWKSSHIVMIRQGLLPLRRELLETVNLPALQKKILIMLNSDSRLPLNSMARKLRIPLTTARNHLLALVDAGVVRRFTAVVQKPSGLYHLACFLHFRYSREHEAMSKEARSFMERVEEPYQPYNTYAMVVETSGYADALDWVAVPNLMDGYAHIAGIEKFYKGTLRNETALIQKVILGSWPVRSVELEDAYDKSSWVGK